MKRALLGVALIATGFSLGFYSAHTLDTKEIPSIEQRKSLGAFDFLYSELVKNAAEYGNAPTPEVERRIEDLRKQTGQAAISAVIELRKSHP